VATVLVALAVALVLAAASRPRHLDLGGLWAFALAGAIVPGLSQVVFVRAIRDAGPSRATIAIGTAPLLSALLAIALLGEPLRATLLVGTVLIVVAGAALAWERTRPEGFRTLGLVLGFVCAALFAARDNVVRWAASGAHVPPLVAVTATLLAATVALSTLLLVHARAGAPRRVQRALLAFVPPGLCLGLAYASLLEAFDRGRVTIVSPLNATQSLWAVVLSAALLRQAEAIGRRTVVAALLMAAGGALVGVLR
jgi:drug/metabolite transporter (DMT)-like permease